MKKTIGWIMTLLLLLCSFSGCSDLETVAGETRYWDFDETVSALQIEFSAGDLKIVQGNSFCLESNHKHLKASVTDNCLSIYESKKILAGNYDGVTIIITIPPDTVFTAASVSTGAGRVKIDTLQANTIDLELGAGKVDIGNIYARTASHIRGGAGQLTIEKGYLHNLDLEMGVGELNFCAQLLGESHLKLGVAETYLQLLGSPDQYSISLNKGIGSGTYNGKPMDGGKAYGSGPNSIVIEGGVGSVHIGFEIAK